MQVERCWGIGPLDTPGIYTDYMGIMGVALRRLSLEKVSHGLRYRVWRLEIRFCGIGNRVRGRVWETGFASLGSRTCNLRSVLGYTLNPKPKPVNEVGFGV